VLEPARIHVRPGKAAIIVLGSSQRALWTDFTLPVRVRSSGGGAVLSGPWLLRAAVALPRTHSVVQHGPAAAARWYGEIHCRWLHANGIGAAALYQGATIDHWACFAGRAAGEIVVGERKIVGIAQAWRGHSVLLSAGTLIAPAPWALLCESLRRSPDAAFKLAALTTNAQDYLRQPVDSRAWAEALLSSLRLAMGQCEESRGLHANATYLRAGCSATTCATSLH
jgi:lipoate-protein ligase A